MLVARRFCFRALMAASNSSLAEAVDAAVKNLTERWPSG